MDTASRVPVVETARLALRRLDHDDLDFVAEMLGDAEVMRHYPKPLDRDEALVWLERQLTRYAKDGHGLWLAQLRETGQPVGQIGLLMQELPGWPEPRYPEIGYLLHRPFWKLGLATEGARGVRGYAFETLGYPKVISLIRPENLPSRAVATRIGMNELGESMFRGRPHLVYGVTARECP